MRVFSLVLMLVLSLPVFASNTPMQTLLQVTDGNMYAGQVPTGYRSVKLTNFVPKGELKQFIIKTTKEKQKAWKEFVLTSGEYEHVSVAERRRIAADPLKAMEVKALLEIEEVYAIYKGNKLIGYFVQITDHVQGAIYQDGAWYDVFTEANLDLVEANDRSA